uniref:Cyanocobalamin reductase / alkylcobalamin dealkylase n=1 Tax=Denticeps clupeoides TaxID=299321 RepID=A0AAY4CLY1_9TELE
TPNHFSKSLCPLSFSVQIGWYNAVLPPSFHLPYHEDTLAVVVLSAPAMFEKLFIPFLQRHRREAARDPVDQCVSDTISSCVSQSFPKQEVDVMYDYEMHPNRKPKFLAQTAAHVAGAAYYYQQCDVPNQPWGSKKMFGVCIHPRWGGWFAIRALLVFRGVESGAELQQAPPVDSVGSRQQRVELLESFNLHWQDWAYRDIIRSEDSYSPRQREYFSTPPGQRATLLQRWGFSPEGHTQTQTVLNETEKIIKLS